MLSECMYRLPACDLGRDLMGFTQCKTDPCVYIKDSASGPIYLAVYVDDLLIVSKT